MEIILNILTLFQVLLQSPGFISGINRTFQLSADFCGKPHFFCQPCKNWMCSEYSRLTYEDDV